MKELIKQMNLPLVRRALAKLGKFKLIYLALIFFFCVMEVFYTLLGTYGMQGAINSLTAGDSEGFIRYFFYIILQNSLWWVYAPIATYFGERISKRTVRDYKAWLGAHIARLPQAFHDSKPIGELLSSLSSDMAGLMYFYDSGLLEVIKSISGGICGIVIMAVIDWRFSIVVLSMGLLSMYLTGRFSRKMDEMSRRQQELIAQNSSDAYELVRAAKTIRLLRILRHKTELIERNTENESNIRRRLGRISARMSAAELLISAASSAVILFAGALFVRYGLSDWGTIIALTGLKFSGDRLFIEAVDFTARLQQPFAGMRRMFALDDEREEEPPANESCNNAALSLEKLGFAYEGREQVLRNFSLEIPKTGFYAIVGGSGTGKSTVLKLILGLYKPSEGKIRVGGGYNSAREAVAYVGQEPCFLRGTIYENIAFGAEDATPERVRRAAALAGADGFISVLPQGYETELIDEGRSLSGGQQQRLALARALLRDAPVLLLDEVSSALDRETEREIFATLRELSKSRAVVCVTHDREAAALSDRIIELAPADEPCPVKG